MARSVTLRKDKKAKVVQRINGEFYSQQDFAEDLGFAASTVSNFVNCRSVDRRYFINICERLGLDWREYAVSPNQLNLNNYSNNYSNNHNFTEPIPSIPNSNSAIDSDVVSDTLEYPEGQMEVDSLFYVERPPIEQRCYEEINKPGALIRIKAPRQMGKSSLLARILHQAEQQGDITIYLSLQAATTRCFSDAETFLKWFCASLARALHLAPNLDEYWELADVMGGNLCCQDYFERYLLPKIDKPITLGLDEVDKVFEYPDISPDFFGLLRVLHEESKQRTIWKRLRLVIAHSTEVYVPINLNQSPFNVGLPAELPEFTPPQVLSGAKIHQIDWSEKEVLQLMEMVGGHPYLVRLALYHIARNDLNLNKLLETAPTTTGIYGTYLRRIESILDEHPELKAGLEELVTNTEQAQLTNKTCSKLNALGLIKVEDGETLPSCKLYQQYFFK
ncbi:MAG: AAA-like domain-containing protein [Rivularia sp. (in: cyanobacteria)]